MSFSCCDFFPLCLFPGEPPKDNVLAKPVEEVVFKEEDKSVKQVNPWGIENLEEFLYYCCPECDEKYKDCQNFIDHAMHAHDSAEVSTLESSNIETEEIIQEESKDEDDCMDPLSFEIDIVEEMKQELQEEVESLIRKDNKLDTQEGLECDSNETENEADDAHSEKQMSKNVPI